MGELASLLRVGHYMPITWPILTDDEQRQCTFDNRRVFSSALSKLAGLAQTGKQLKRAIRPQSQDKS